jgi:hypothetical protein
MVNLREHEAFASENNLTVAQSSLEPQTNSLAPTAGTGGRQSIIAPSPKGCDLPDRGPFPLDALPPVIRDYAMGLAAAMQIPVELSALCIVSTVSGALGKGWEAISATAERKTRGNIFMVLSLPPGAGKSISNRISAPIRRIESQREANWRETQASKLESERQALEAEIHRLKRVTKGTTLNRQELETKVTALESVKRKLGYSAALITGNATTSGLAGELARVDHETLWVYAPEGAEVFRVMFGVFRKEGTDMDLWLSGYSGEPYKQTRASSGNGTSNTISLKDPCLSALLMVQPVVLEELLSNDAARERGLLTRVLPVSIDVPIAFDDGSDRRVDPQSEQAWDNLVCEILTLRFNASGTRELKCSPEAAGVFRDFHNQTTYEWSSGKYADFRTELSRWRENAIKLAVVLQIATNPHSVEITAEIARHAVRLFLWIGIGALDLCSGDRKEKIHTRALALEKALNSYGGACLASDLHKRNGFKMPEIRQLVGGYSQIFQIEEVKGTGRPGKLIKLVMN